MQINLVFFVLLILGLLSKNNSLIISSLLLFGIRIFKLDDLLPVIDQYSVKVGIILIMLGVLTPVATGDVDLLQIVDTIKSPIGLISVIMGVLVTQFTREGLSLMDTAPEVIPNLVAGIIVGIAFFRGVPSGPLIASGITAFLIKIFRSLG
ncbi:MULTISPECIES: DUF441 domain-containing protein [unclassified Candidatus Frackibacter]|uniref:DUF441 domain-containing protein n=1 Tax=unclassified Candidatus Frackibacter TaxID=2648818 RepID=UPI0008891891|nr:MULTISPECIES: DUF441 domain-containing protein [unclassified Candidatus Frackibacter]SDC11219.1 Uncharacterized membrane protein, DUF441 family [Candidatus Frackibacter sp. WG11]SEM36623.1 Uncharacterized membrane protein, DUF441 family [Candidatus Frackibacter sp. WG12]SFL41943.1 Uncharacterized membrane protein, DUF441 family [Candidatus Frackibacter sp. WG13]